MRLIIRTVILSLFVLWVPHLALAGEASSVTIFFLGSGSADTPWTKAVSQGLTEQINQSRHPYLYFIDHLEAARFDEVEQYDLMFRYLKEKFADREPDIFVAAGPAASSFSVLHPELFPEAKRVLIEARADNSGAVPLNSPNDAAIVINSKIDYSLVIGEVLRLSAPKKVFVIGDTEKPSDRYRLNRVVSALKRENVPIEILDNIALPDLLVTVAELPAKSAIFFTPIYREYKGKGLVPALVLKKIHEVSSSPIFSSSDSTLGFGTVGGFLYSPQKLGEMAGKTVLSMLRNEPVNAPSSSLKLAFDWREVVRWGFRDQISPDAKIFFREPTLWEQYKKEVLFSTIAFWLLIALLTALFLNNRQLKKAKVTLSEDRILLEKRIEERTRDLSRLHKIAEKAARTDDLTKLDNRRAFFEKGEMIHRQAQRYQKPYSIMMLDIDWFKKINDTHGHTVGDRVIKEVAEVIQSVTRQSDVAARIGGEEYAVILIETDQGQLQSLAERVRRQVAESPIKYARDTIYTTLSIGIAQYRSEDKEIYSVLERADKALYMAKQTGRNKAIIHSEMWKGAGPSQPDLMEGGC